MNSSKLPGAAASAAWLEQRGLHAGRTPHWYVDIIIESESPDTRFEMNIYPEEWGYVFRRGPRMSSIRITDVPFVHGLDDHRLLSQTPPLDRIGDLLVALERKYDFAFHRESASVKSNLTRATGAVRSWLEGQR